MKATIAVLGAGAWGATLADLLAAGGHQVRLWDRSEESLTAIEHNGHPPGCPELQMDETVDLEPSLEKALAGTDAAVIVIPSQAVDSLCLRLAEEKLAPPVLVLASKGIDIATLRPLSEVVHGRLPSTPVAVLSGPCIAREVATRAIPTSAVVACEDGDQSQRLQEWFHRPWFRMYRHQDVRGVEYGGALKNIIAIAAGASDGLGFGSNSKAALVCRGLAEMTRLAVALGADPRTLSGLSGLGDLTVTCFSPLSRNRSFGELIAKGRTTEEAKKEIGMVVEGIPAAEAAMALAKRCGVDVPIAEVVHAMTSGRLKPLEALNLLMSREPKAEFGEEMG